MNDYKEVKDSDLLKWLQKDDTRAFKELYHRYWKKVYGSAFKRLKNKEQSEEIVQEIFVTLWSNRQALKVRSSLGGYLYASVKNQVIDRYRKELVRQKHTEALKVTYKEDAHSIEEIYHLKELLQTIELGVQKLPDKCRSVYELSRKEYKTNKEIAHHLGISEKTVENHLTKALNRLRTSLGNYLSFLLFLLLK